MILIGEDFYLYKSGLHDNPQKISWMNKIFETNENVINKTVNNLKNW